MVRRDSVFYSFLTEGRERLESPRDHFGSRDQALDSRDSAPLAATKVQEQWELEKGRSRETEAHDMETSQRIEMILVNDFRELRITAVNVYIDLRG
jgi:hypothetical protein